MSYKIYRTPYPANRLDTAVKYEKGIADLLLNFDETIHTKEGIHTVVTVPAKNKIGFNVVACRSFVGAVGHAAYVLLPETERIYLFSQAMVPIRDAGKRFLKAGFKGLLLGAEEKKVVCQAITEDDVCWRAACTQNISQDDWYHFTGTANKILEELQKKCAPIWR